MKKLLTLFLFISMSAAKIFSQCAAPFDLVATVTNDTIVTLKWHKTTTTAKTEFEIYVADGNLVKLGVVSDSILIIKDLPKCQKFVARVKTQCDSTHQSAPSNYVTFATSGCPLPVVCVAPSNLVVSVTSDTVVTLKWQKTSATSKTELEIYNLDGALIKSALIYESVLVYKDLPKCKSFIARVKTQCDSTHLSAPSNYVTFETTRCASPVCNKVSRLAFVGVDTASAQGVWEAAGTGKYYIEYKLATDSVHVWTKDSSTQTYITLKKLKKCATYVVRVLSVCGTKLDTSATDKFSTTCPKPICVHPYGIRYKLTNDTVATLYWWIKGAKNFVLQYQPIVAPNSNNWITVSGADSFTVIKGLKSCTAYQVRLRALCDSINPDWLYFAFKTTGTCPLPTGCYKPSDVEARFVGDSTFVFWNYPIASSASLPTFEIQYKLSTDANYGATIKATSVFTILRGLINCKSYTLRVRAICSTTTTSDWMEYNFKAGARCFGIDGSGVTSFVNTNALNPGTVLVSPNPGSSTDPEVAFELMHASNVSIKLFNSTGSAVIINNLGNLNVGTYYQKLNNASDLSNGLYIISVQADGEAPITTRWIKL